MDARQGCMDTRQGSQVRSGMAFTHSGQSQELHEEADENAESWQGAWVAVNRVQM